LLSIILVLKEREKHEYNKPIYGIKVPEVYLR